MTYQHHLVWPLAALVLGGLVGNAAEHLPIRPAGQSVVAMVVSWFVALLLVSIVLQLRFPRASEISVPSLNLRQVVLTSALAAVIAVVLHAALSWERLNLRPDWLRHRTVGIGIAGFLAGSIHAILECGLDDLS